MVMENAERMLDSRLISLHNSAVYTATRLFDLDPGKLFSDINRFYGKHLVHPEGFDEYSYQIYKRIAGHVPEHERRIEFTRIVGEEMYKKIEIIKTIRCSRDPDDIRGEEGWKRMLRKTGEYFQEAGYITGFELKFRSIFNKKKWEKQGKANFIYTMKEPVILQGAKKLFQEEGFAQHTSSRAMQAGLKRYEIEGSEKDFDPGRFKTKTEPIDELWEIRKIGFKRQKH